MKLKGCLLALCVLALLGLPGAATAQGDTKVTGEVLYRERIALPASAIVTVRLEDVSLADAPAVVIAEQVIEPMGKGPPYAFALAYDPANIDERHTYAVRAQIKDGERLLFTTTQRYPVITQGNPTSGVQVIVQMVGGTAPSASLPAEMLDRDWSLAALQRAPQNVENTTGTNITIRFGGDGTVGGSGGCNSFFGSYTVGPNQQLTLSGLGATLKACDEATNRLEAEYFDALRSVASYTYTSPTSLQLVYNDGKGLLTYTSAPPGPQPLCFSQTGYCIGGRFLQYWQQNGGLAVFGYPLSNEMIENGRTVQYFERQRFELHPEQAAPYDVLLGRLGDELLKRRGVDWQTLPKAEEGRQGCRFFPETQHNVCNVPGGLTFLGYWSSHGLEFDGRPGKSYAESLALFGLPLTEAEMQTNPDGDTVMTQWFERARFEYHPNNPVAYRVLLGRLGAEILAPVASSALLQEQNEGRQ